MPLSDSQITQLRTELQTDPRGYGYNAAARNDSAIQEKINRPRDGQAGNVPATPTADGGVASGIIKLNNTSVDTGAIRTAITKAAYDGLTTGDRAWINWLSGAGSILVNADNLQTLAGVPTATGAVWSTATRTAMNAAMDGLLRKFGSRAEEKWGTNVTLDEIGRALNQ